MEFAVEARALAEAWGRTGRAFACWPVPACLPSDRAELGKLLDAAPEPTLELMEAGFAPGEPMPLLPHPAPLSALLEREPERPFLLRIGPLLPWWRELAAWPERWRAFLAQVLGASVARRTEVRLDLYLASPGAVSRFHADPSHNLVHQVTGRRTLRVFSPLDERLIDARSRPGVYLERGIHPRYRADCEDSARELELAPGSASYVPPRAGHWVRNGAELSVSYTVSLRTPADFREKYCHAMNQRLASLGLEPRVFGRSPLRDSVKARVESLLRRSRFVRSG